MELTLDVSNFDVQEGDQVEIGIEEGAVVIASLLVYGLPVLSLLGGIALAGWFGFAGIGMFVMCVVGMLGGVALARLLIKSHFRPTFFEPVLLRRLPKLS
jgi:sigma-E factor negative regulatory protein RseC